MIFKKFISLCIENARKTLDFAYLYYDSFLCLTKDFFEENPIMA